MNIAVLGASGWLGSTISAEALARGHRVIGLARNPQGLAEGVTARAFDLNTEQSLAEALAGADLLIASVGGRAAGNHEIVPATAARLLAELPKAGVKRLLWVGGAGSLEVAPGEALVAQPSFPAEYKAEAIAQGEALAVFRDSQSPLAWTFVSPAAEIYPGERSGAYRLGGDQLLVDSEGRSRISAADYAVALVDLAEQGAPGQTRVSVAY